MMPPNTPAESSCTDNVPTSWNPSLLSRLIFRFAYYIGGRDRVKQLITEKVAHPEPNDDIIDQMTDDVLAKIGKRQAGCCSCE